jgi:pyruvate,water dikinase
MEPNGLTPLAVPLDSPSATLELVGGKGASLARLSQAGLPVPPGFHLTTAAYRKFVEDNALQTAILDAVQPARADDPASLDRAAERIRTLLVGARMPVAVAAEIGRRYDEMGGGAVAVRSSATAEDLPGMSFAGQLETFLNVCDADAVVDAVRLCWASLWTARAIGYRIRQGIAPDSVGIAVVVQKLVAADVAGILLTANPVTGARDEIVINAAWGLGEAVVGGLVTPDTYTVNRKTNALVSQDIAVKETMTVRLASGTREEPVAPEKRNAATLTADQALDLAKTGETIERLYGMPMDIEWALCAGCSSSCRHVRSRLCRNRDSCSTGPFRARTAVARGAASWN